jgi:transporter family-2 protein
VGKMTALIIALLAGATMAIQGSLNSVLGKVLGLVQGTLVVHIVGLMAALALYLAKSGPIPLKEAPWYTLLGGALGVLIIYGVAVSIPRLGVVSATTAIIVGQVTTAALVDHFGLFTLEPVPFTWLKALGFVLLVAGGWLMLK